MRRWKCLLAMMTLCLVFAVTACASASPTLLAKPTSSETVSPRTTAPLPTFTPTVPQQTLNLRTVDWATFIASDPNLAHPDNNPFNLQRLTGPYVATDGKDLSKEARGFAMIDDIFYASIMGSPQEQAFVWLNGYPVFPECGGTIHTGLLIYKTDNDHPELAAAIGGYDLSATVSGGKMIVQDMVPTDFAFRGKCDTSGFRETRYRWQSNHLGAESFFQVSYGLDFIDVAQSFYDLLQAKEYSTAYALLSPAFQAVNPFDRWVAGYRNIISINAAFSAERGFVDAHITTIEQTDSVQTTKHYEDKWLLVRDSKSPPGQWYLDHPENIPHL